MCQNPGHWTQDFLSQGWMAGPAREIQTQLYLHFPGTREFPEAYVVSYSTWFETEHVKHPRFLLQAGAPPSAGLPAAVGKVYPIGDSLAEELEKPPVRATETQLTRFYLIYWTKRDKVTHGSPRHQTGDCGSHPKPPLGARGPCQSVHCELRVQAPCCDFTCFTFWKDTVIVQFQRAVHTGKRAFTGRAPINETATKTNKNEV